MPAELTIPDEPWVALAETVSLASAISPALLRHARLELHPELGPDAEGMVWMSAFVERRTSSHIWLSTAAANELRRRLRRREGVDRAWLHLSKILAAESPLDFAEAELSYRGLSGRDHDPKTTQLLRQLVVSAADNPGFAEWALRVLPSLSAGAAGVEGWALELIAHTRRGTTTERADEPPPGLLELPWSRLLPEELPTTEVGVRRERHCLRFRSSPADGFITLTVPRSRPVVVFVEVDDWDGQRVLRRGVTLPRDGVTTVDVPNRPIRVRTLDRRQYSLERRPARTSDWHRVSASELARHWWSAAEVLRGALEIGNYKRYVLGLIFYKRISDIELERRMDERGQPPSPERRFEIPPGCVWEDVSREHVRVGSALGSALSRIEAANPSLRGVFAGLEFSTSKRFPEDRLRWLLEHLSQQRLGRGAVDGWVFGDAYEALLWRFAEASARKGGEFYTPRAISKLMVDILDPKEGQAIYDPACGTGGALLEAVRHVESSGAARPIAVHGQEKNLDSWAICKQRMFLHDLDDARIERGDALVAPALFHEGGTLQTFDVVLSNPPFSLKNWGYEAWAEGDRFGRDVFGCPPRSAGDFAFIQHMLASLGVSGRMAVVCPPGVLFRGGAEGRIRERIVAADLIEAVIGLGANLFYSTGIPTALLVFNRAKGAERAGRILFVDGSEEIERGRTYNTLSANNVGRLAGAVRRFEDQPRFCRVVEFDEIRSHNHDLSVRRYVRVDLPPLPVDVKQEASRLIDLMRQRDRALAEMLKLLRELGYGARGPLA